MKTLILHGLFWVTYYIGSYLFYKQNLVESSRFLRLSLSLIAGVIFPVTAFYLTHDIIVVAHLRDKYNHEKMVEIKETVEFPGSVYWEDNVFPGFDLLSRRWMIEQYLDGVHLQTLALNGDDGKIYLYRATAEHFAESKELQEQVVALKTQADRIITRGRKYREGELAILRPKREELYKQIAPLSRRRQEIHDKAVLAVMSQVEVFNNPGELPSLDYKVVLSQTPLPIWQERYIYSDKISIIDQKRVETIAWSRRVERYQYTIEPDLVGGRFLFETLAGNGKIAYFDDKILFPHINPPRGWFSRTDDFKRVYKSNIERIYYGR